MNTWDRVSSAVFCESEGLLVGRPAVSVSGPGSEKVGVGVIAMHLR